MTVTKTCPLVTASGRATKTTRTALLSSFAVYRKTAGLSRRFAQNLGTLATPNHRGAGW